MVYHVLCFLVCKCILPFREGQVIAIIQRNRKNIWKVTWIMDQLACKDKICLWINKKSNAKWKWENYVFGIYNRAMLNPRTLWHIEYPIATKNHLTTDLTKVDSTLITVVISLIFYQSRYAIPYLPTPTEAQLLLCYFHYYFYYIIIMIRFLFCVTPAKFTLVSPIISEYNFMYHLGSNCSFDIAFSLITIRMQLVLLPSEYSISYGS